MAARSHSDSFEESKNNKKPPPVGGQAMILPKQSKNTTNNKVAPVPLDIFVDERDHDRCRIIKESKRPRFMRWKNSDKYPSKKADI
jgi:hypothetical protein